MCAALACAGVISTGVAFAAPQATTEAATSIAATSATLNGSVVRDGQTTYHFEYGTTTAYGSRTPDKNVSGGGGSGGRSVNEDVSGLQPSTTYHFRLVAVSATGTANGADLTFATPAAGPNDNVVTIGASPRTVRFGSAATVAGRITGPDSANTRVDLQQDPFPFEGTFVQLANGTSDAAGNYTFQVTPPVNTRYHVEARTGPTSTSPEQLVRVRPKVALKVGDRTPARGARVRFRGTVLPAHDGQPVLIQRRGSKRWRTVKQVALVAATPVNGVARSRYSTRVRIGNSGRWRVVKPSDGDHARGASKAKRIRVH